MSLDPGLERAIARWMADDLDLVRVPVGALERVADEVARTRQQRPRSGAPARSTIMVTVWAAMASALALGLLIRPLTQPPTVGPGAPGMSAAAARALCESVKDETPALAPGGRAVLWGSYSVDPGDVAAYVAVIGPDVRPSPRTRTPGMVVCLIDGSFRDPGPHGDGAAWMRSQDVIREDDPRYSVAQLMPTPTTDPAVSSPSSGASGHLGPRRD